MDTLQKITQKINFSVDIMASPEKVWKTLWNDNHYRDWTSIFSEGSYVKGEFKEGNTVLFLSPSGDGLYSEVARMIPDEFMSFRHLGVAKEGKEQPLDEETKQWSGALENYELKKIDGGTRLRVDMDVTPEYLDYFKQKFPEALNKVKEIAESM